LKKRWQNFKRKRPIGIWVFKQQSSKRRWKWIKKKCPKKQN